MKFLFVILVLLQSIAWSNESQGLTIQTKDKVYRFHQKENVRVSENCLKSNCLALQRAELKTKKADGKYVGHPASDFCEQEKGEYIVGKRESGDEDGVCVFKDNSYILGWDYFKRNQKEKK
ncbi:MAG: DUF333 domain-containing protein [Bacteriovoracia bacterium]